MLSPSMCEPEVCLWNQSTRRQRPAHLADTLQWTDERACTSSSAAHALPLHLGLPGARWQIAAQRGEMYRSTGNLAKAMVLEESTILVNSLAPCVNDQPLHQAFLAVRAGGTLRRS
jgi:hypothetical protein